MQTTYIHTERLLKTIVDQETNLMGVEEKLEKRKPKY